MPVKIEPFHFRHFDAVGPVEGVPARRSTVGGEIATEIPDVEQRLEGDMAVRGIDVGRIELEAHQIRMPDGGGHAAPGA